MIHIFLKTKKQIEPYNLMEASLENIYNEAQQQHPGTMTANLTTNASWTMGMQHFFFR